MKKVHSKEYRVRLYEDKVLNPSADYFTDDKEDAILTAYAMVRQVTKTPWPEQADIEYTKTKANPLQARPPLSIPFNVATLHIASRIFPLGFDVSADAPDSLAKVISHFENTGRICVWSGASENTVFGDAEVNYAFRAWHDSKHLQGKHHFSESGESAVADMQCADIRALFGNTAEADYFCLIVQAEVMGQLEYKEKFGGFPLDQYGFTAAYVTNPESAMDSAAFGLSHEGVDS
jgi:hypothetical protein